LSNGEKHERRWLVYSTDLDRVLCFYCKLFNVIGCTNKLGNQGSRDYVLLNILFSIKNLKSWGCVLLKEKS